MVVKYTKSKHKGERRFDYTVSVTWTGNTGLGTEHYLSFSRDTEISAAGKDPIASSTDARFLGKDNLWNPEELLVASLSCCHKHWFLALASINNIVVLSYRDEASGVMVQKENGGGYFESVTLKPEIVIEKSVHIPAALKACIRTVCNAVPPFRLAKMIAIIAHAKPCKSLTLDSPESLTNCIIKPLNP